MRILIRASVAACVGAAAAASVAILASACGGDSAPASPDAGVDCSMAPGVQAYVPGVAALADDGTTQVVLVSASPAPPTRFANMWSLVIRDKQGQALVGRELKVNSFMPAHGHGAALTSSLVAGTGPGSYELGPFDLWMPGVWEMRFEVTQYAPSSTSTAVLSLCVQE